MEIGLFAPSAYSGWLVTDQSPTKEVDFPHARDAIVAAERAGMDFALTMVKFRGFGGPSHFWENALESFTLTAGVAAVTERIKLFASVGVLALPPVYAAQMALTIGSIAPGRFGLNIVSGWQKAEYDQMGVWPGESHYERRYDYCTEYVQIMKELWDEGTCEFHGDFFDVNSARLRFSPPHTDFEIVCAGQSERGMRFCAEVGDYNFTLGTGLNTPTAHADRNAALLAEAEKAGRDVGAIPSFLVVGGETDEEAMATWNHYADHADRDALSWLIDQAQLDHQASDGGTLKTVTLPEGAVTMGFGRLVGSYETLAELLDEAAGVPGTKGLMLAFDDNVRGPEWFAERVQPLMQTRRGVTAVAK
jgi:pyrimidine oxygenase